MDTNQGHVQVESKSADVVAAPGTITGSFVVAQSHGKWHWRMRVDDLSINGGPYVSRWTCVLGLLHQFAMALESKTANDLERAEAKETRAKHV